MPAWNENKSIKDAKKIIWFTNGTGPALPAVWDDSYRIFLCGWLFGKGYIVLKSTGGDDELEFDTTTLGDSWAREKTK